MCQTKSAERAQYNPRPLLNVAEALIRRNRCDVAMPYLNRAERMLPQNYFVHLIRGRALACLGRLDEARAELELAKAVEITDREDRAIVEADLKTEPWFGL